SNTDAFHSMLIHQLGFLRGLSEPILDGGTVVGWIGEGGDREDDNIRSLRHFHDPLRPWDSAGLKLGGARFSSSVRWMQRNEAVQGWSWPQVRALYWAALTTRDPILRNEYWTDTFRGIGQIMHLVVDASVPEHTRTDAHPLEGVCRQVGLSCYGN